MVREARRVAARRIANLTAQPGQFSLMPTTVMREALERDYRAMIGMVFGKAPSLDEVLAGVAEVEKAINA